MAKAFFQANDVKYEEKDVATDIPAQKEMIEKSGQMGVPVIDINGSIILGFDKGKITKLLNL
jgi:glutaredoxin